MKCCKCNTDVMVLFNTNGLEVCIECYEPPRDRIVDQVLDKYKERAKFGYAKYKTTMDRKDLSLYEWINNLQEELMDATLYIEKIKTELEPSWDNIHFKLSEQGFYNNSNEEDATENI